MSTFNVRTIRNSSNIGELIAAAEKYQIDIIGIQEHRIHHADTDIKFHQLTNSWQLITTSATQNTIGATVGGVAILLSPYAGRSLINVETISPRLMICHFQGNPATTVLCCYSPTNYAKEEDITSFYNDLREAVKTIPRHNIQIILGDMNARIGTDKAKFAYCKSTNRNGEHLINFSEEYGYILGNTRFQKSKSKQWTARLPNGHKAQLDYIMINRKC